MQEVTIYQGSQEITIVEAVPPQEIDAAFLASWLFGKSEKTQAAYTADMQKFYSFTGKPLQRVSLDDIQAFIMSLSDLKTSGQARCIAAIKSALSFGVKSGWLVGNVGVLVTTPHGYKPGASGLTLVYRPTPIVRFIHKSGG